MDTLNTDSMLVVFSIKLYGLLLALYPSGFRQEYGSWMVQVFSDHARAQTRQRGLPGLLAWWGRTMLDTLVTAIEEHSQKGVDMSKAKFIKLSGWGMVLGGLVVFVALLAISRPEYSPYNFANRWYDQYLNAAKIPLILTGFLLLIIGMVGLWVRYGQAAGVVGRLFLVISGLGSLAGGVGILGLTKTDSEPWWTTFILGLLGLFVGQALFGIVCLQRRLLPRWNALPLLSGVWLPLFFGIGLPYQAFTGRTAEVPDLLSFAIFSVGLVGFVGVGYLLQSDAANARYGAAKQA